MPENVQLKRRRVRAVLAGGLVLGVGAAVTLAAWNDSEFAIGNFAAGQFNLEGSADGTVFSEHETPDGAATLGFEVNPDNLAPEDVVYAPFAVRLDEDTTYGANVVVSATEVDGDLTDVTYELLQTTTFGCDDTTTGTGLALVAAGTSLGAELGEVSFNLAQPTTTGTGPNAVTTFAPVYLCFVVTAGDITQGAAGTATWEFAAESLS
ncbi:hypothetical protein AC792_04000 [Arthrobacter sp. RIT-PI-e]|nr:hypothetical protein AC792_04000 [Arthrobacter sp. RIT-PI-e]